MLEITFFAVVSIDFRFTIFTKSKRGIVKIKEILKKIDKILKDKDDFSSVTELEKGGEKAKSTFYKLFGLFKKIFNFQYSVIANYLREELKIALKNDLKLVVIIIGFLALITVIFAVFWLFISLAITAYFYESGYGILNSLLYTMGIHLLVIIVLSIGIYISSQNFEIYKVYKKIKKASNFKRS